MKDMCSPNKMLKSPTFAILLFAFCQVSAQTYTDIIREVTISESQKDCGQVDTCNTTMCESNVTICGPKCQSGRFNFPILRVISPSSSDFKDCVKSNPIKHPPNISTDKTLELLPSMNCSQKIDVNSTVTVSFWIQGNCTNCTLFVLSGDMNMTYRISLEQTNLMVRGMSYSGFSSSEWNFMAFRVMRDRSDIFVGRNFVRTISTTVKSVNVEPYVQGNDELTLSDISIYEDYLTDKEIESLRNMSRLGEECRCPSSHPNRSSADNCTDNSTEVKRLDGDGFYTINDIVHDGNRSLQWMSNNTMSVEFIIRLYDIYQIQKVSVTKNEGQIKWEISEDEKEWENLGECTVSSNTCMPSNTPVGGAIRVTLNSTTPVQFIISEISVTGKCACNGKEDNCSRQFNYQMYTCNCQSATNTTGKNCEKCISSFSKKDGTCECHDGYYNASNNECRQCNSQGSLLTPSTIDVCTCKLGVTGKTCDTCLETSDESNNCSGGIPKPCNCSIKVPEMEPKYGPMSGSTAVTITGLDINYIPDVSIGGQKQNITINNSSRLVFNTMPSNGSSEDLILSYYNTTWEPNGFYQIHVDDFEFKPDPELVGESDKRAAIGCKIKFGGKNLQSVYKPTITFGSANSESQVCESTDGETITCTIPSNIGGKEFNASLDLDCPNCGHNFRLVVISEPTVLNNEAFDFTSPFTKTIEITGRDFKLCDKDMVMVTLGVNGTECVITDITDASLTCTPPTSPPNSEQKQYILKLKMGDMKEVDVGKLNYKDLVDSVYFIYIMVGVAGFIVLVLIIIATVCFWRRNGNSRDSQYNPNAEISMDPVISRPNEYIGIDKPSAITQQTSLEDMKRKFLRRLEHGNRNDIADSLKSADEFTLGKICTAKGDKARRLDGILVRDRKKLTIKSLKHPLPDNGALPAWVSVALKECIRFRTLKDTNILNIYGIALEKHKFHILYPYMHNRTLKDHVSDTEKEFSIKQLLEYAVHVVDGMCFLSDRSIYHRDLAARNVMVDHSDTAKIADASFSYDFYPTEYMHDTLKNRYLPVRWMAPESLSNGFYDSKSDVWSFGVLLWELLTRGCFPFVDTADSQIEECIKEGYRLGQPAIISNKMYDILNRYWEEDSDYRPTFEEISKDIGGILSNDKPEQEDVYVNITKKPIRQSIYMNSASMRSRGSSRK
ncbi:uncharacterized protein LOC126815730 [Patella vulgata]|uniref:uncharacterized protein LOC126815730 n=1 Tax=Patella vulgata TaxID=6465 RepID=UPI0021807ED8|nr:uncharacterized protein LOC126815730 [Patella vulgata]XP_050397581.1 uncharacterized protein LOC126815730 [Patella vulgata]